MDLRELKKALEIAARFEDRLRGRRLDRPFAERSGAAYTRDALATPRATRAQCEDFQASQKPCKHIIAVRLVQERDSTAANRAVVVERRAPKRPTYKQNWPLYNLAQTTEKHRSAKCCLRELCRGVADPAPRPRTAAGGPTPLADQVFASAFKVYSTFSSRRFNCDLQDAFEKGYLSRPIHAQQV